VAPAAKAALELQRQHSNCTVAFELQKERSNYTTALELQRQRSNCTAGRTGSSSSCKQGAREMAPTAKAALELQRQRSNCTVVLEVQNQRSNYTTALEFQRQRSKCTDGGAHGSAPRGRTCSVAPAAENRRRTGSAPDLSNVCMNTGFMFHPCCATNVSYHCV